ncbi:MAG: (d)CMP kinase [Alphaproteobacteria bacterium]|nr:(d)CMP kinase [Alphaproteobacteria bacterium]
MNRFVMCLDGLSGTGKTVLSKKLVKKIDAEVVSLGALFRAIAYYMELNKIADPKAVVGKINKDKLAWSVIEGMLESHVIQNEKYARGAVRLFSVPEVSSWGIEFLRLQPYRLGNKPMIFEGRGKGQLFPFAPLKIWLDAHDGVRFARKHGDAVKLGTGVAFSDTVKSLVMREEFEKRDPVVPALPSSDAIRIDTTNMSEDAVCEKVLRIYNDTTKLR